MFAAVRFRAPAPALTTALFPARTLLRVVVLLEMFRNNSDPPERSVPPVKVIAELLAFRKPPEERVSVLPAARVRMPVLTFHLSALTVLEPRVVVPAVMLTLSLADAVRRFVEE